MKSKKLKYIVLFILLLIFIVLLLIFPEEKEQKTGVIQKNDVEQDQKLEQETTIEQEAEEILDSAEEQIQEIYLGENLMITSIESYSGKFMEDGSDEEVSGILMITVRNDGDKTLQYAEAELIFGNSTAQFAFSTLRPGASMVVMEKNRMEYPEKKDIKEALLANVIFFEKSLNFCEDKLKISAMDGVFNVENISGGDLSENVVIYYKNKKEDLYYGGITYRTIIEGGIEKDGIKQIMTKHFTLDESEVMFVEYTEME